MADQNLYSRREFAAALGGAAFVVGGALYAERPGPEALLADIVGRCGVLRFGCSGEGHTPAGHVETQHARQIALLLSWWRPDALCRYSSTGSLSKGMGERHASSLMTALHGSDGARMEVVTCTSALSGPILTLRGEDGSLQATHGALWFTQRPGAAGAREEALPLPGCYWNAFCAARDEAPVPGPCREMANHILENARGHLFRDAPARLC